jgi:hypothetical protein
MKTNNHQDTKTPSPNAPVIVVTDDDVQQFIERKGVALLCQTAKAIHDAQPLTCEQVALN